MFQTENLRALLNKEKGLAHQNRFKVTLPQINATCTKPDGGSPNNPYTAEDLTMLCTAANLPGKQFTTFDRQLGIENLKVAYGHTFSDVQLTFYLTGVYSLRDYFQEWAECVISKEPPFEAGYFEDYAARNVVKIEQMDKEGKKIYGVELRKVYPTSVGDIQLNNQQVSGPLELTVSLAFSNYVKI